MPGSGKHEPNRAAIRAFAAVVETQKLTNLPTVAALRLHEQGAIDASLISRSSLDDRGCGEFSASAADTTSPDERGSVTVDAFGMPLVA